LDHTLKSQEAPRKRRKRVSGTARRTQDNASRVNNLRFRYAKCSSSNESQSYVAISPADTTAENLGITMSRMLLYYQRYEQAILQPMWETYPNANIVLDRQGWEF
jgi:hypothetical protein